MRSLQVRLKKDIKTERERREEDCKFCDDFGISADNADIRSLRDKT